MSERTFVLNTSFGNIAVTLRELGGRTAGAVVFPPEMQPQFNAEPFDHKVEALESLVLAHACAGVDVQAPEYINGLNAALHEVVYNGD